MVSEPMVLVSSIRNVAVPRGLVDLTSTPPLKLAVPWGGEAARHPLAQFLSSGRVSISQMMRSEEHTSELQSLMRISYAVFCLNKKKKTNPNRYQVTSNHTY